MSLHRTQIVSLLLWSAVLAGFATAFAFLRGLNDADLFWHLLNGEQLLATGRPVTVDPYSFTYPGGVRLPHEWLTEGLMYILIESIGPDVTLAAFSLALPLGFLCLGLALVSRGVPVPAVAIATILPAMVAFPYLSVRPQVLSWTLLALELALLISLDQQRRLWILALIPLFVLWANLHGLYAVGLAVLGWYALWTLTGRTELRESRLLVVGVLLGTVAGTVISPGGFATLLYPLRFLRAGDWGLENIPEWASPNFHDAIQIPVLLLIIALALAARARTPGWLGGLGIIGVVMTLMANRNAPVLAVFAIPVMAHAAATWMQQSPRRPKVEGSARGRRTLESLIVVVLVGACVSVVLGSPRGIQLGRFPDAAVDVLSERQPDARVFAEYGWGGFVAYRLHDQGGRVFVDGRNDMYPESVLDDYIDIRNAETGWGQLVEQYGVEAVLLPPDAPLVRGIAQAHGWCELLRDDKQVLLMPCALTERVLRP